MPLHLKLRRGERLLVNGAVIEIGSRFGEVVIHNQSHCLREAELMREAEANSPTRRLYFKVQSLIVDPGVVQECAVEAQTMITELETVFSNHEILAQLRRVRESLAGGDAYAAMSLLRAVMKYEDMLLAAAKLRAARDLERAAHGRLLQRSVDLSSGAEQSA
jgi:flagellar biosynthesis repressor protein FlbT